MDGTLISIIVPLLLFFVIVAIVLYLSVRVVNQYERLVVFRLGKTRPELVKEPGLRFLIARRRPARQGGRARGLRRDPQPDEHHQGQRAHRHRLPHLLPHRRPALQRREHLRLPGGAAGHRHDDPARGHRRHEPRRRALQARPDQRRPARPPRRADRALGRQGHHGRDPRARPAARRAGFDEPHAHRGAHATRRHHRVRGRAPVQDQRRRGREAVGHPARRG